MKEALTDPALKASPEHITMCLLLTDDAQHSFPFLLLLRPTSPLMQTSKFKQRVI